jgi:hypothetical protein
MNITIDGTLEAINETEIITGKEFQKRSCVLKTHEQYPQELLIEFIQDDVEKLDGFSVGQTVTMSVNLKGRKWISPEDGAKYFTSLQGWKIEQ